MVIMALDVETYKYDEKTKTYKPSLNTRDFVLGCIMISGRKNPIFFYNADEMFKYIFEFVKQKRTEGHNTFIYGHKHIYDLASYGMNYMHRVDILKIFVQNPLFAKLQPKTKMQIKCKRCKDEYTYEGNETVINCPKCRERKLLPTGFLLDTRSFYKSKLEDVGRLLGFPKLEMPKEIENIHQLRNYVKRDVEITLNSIFELKNKMNLLGHNPKKLLTSGSLAMTYFKTWLKKQKYKDTTYSGYLYQKGKIHPTKFHNFIRMAYRGARCECFHSGKYENVTMIDINSLYPKVLSEMKMPDLLSEQRIIDPLFMYSKEELLNKIGIAKAKIKVPNKDGLMYMPCKREGKGIYFPNKIQELTSYWTLFELKRAEMEGYE
ncbi:hypothetical protein HOA56_04715, partial [archaeon]|nr:hypothetical protein [archaeon]